MMIKARAPFRISFFGGGTDYPEYYNSYGGCVLSTTIDKYCSASLRQLMPIFPFRNQLTYSIIERFNDPDEVKHPLVREAIKLLPVDRIQIVYDADLPACTGLGTSSSFAVALLAVLHANRNETFTKASLAEEAVLLERHILNEAGGVQDQYAAAFGGFNRMDFTAEGVRVSPVCFSEEAKIRLESRLHLLFTGFTRYSFEVSKAQKANITGSIPYLDSLCRITDTAQALLENGDVDAFGALLDEEWRLKKQLSGSITNPTIDMLYQKAKNAGAAGGKILGAGGGGFMLLYVPEESTDRFLRDFSSFEFVDFRFEDQGVTVVSHNQRQ